MSTSSHSDITLDFGRAERLGMDEAIFCAGKSVEQLSAILTQAEERDARLLLTRLDAGSLQALPAAQQSMIDYEPLSSTGFFGSVEEPSVCAVAIVTAGTSDTPASREAVRTLRYYGQRCVEINDVGVAGLERLLRRIEEIRQQPIVIVAAGMDAALPSVVGGLVPGAVIAIPTSTGYGVAQGGVTALHAALASCAPGVTVVNIDNGYGAACAALRILHTLGRR